jgi:hypothetical protein
MAKEVLEMEVKSNIGEVAKDTKKLTTESTKAQKGVGGISKAFKGMGTAIKAAGIGLVVALLAKLMEVFSKNQKVLDIFNTSMTALSIAFNDLFGFIENNIGTIIGYFKDLFENPVEKIKELGIAITEGLVNRFMELLDVVGLVGKSLVQLVIGDFSGALDTIKQAGRETVDVFTGVDESLESVVETITAYTTETLKQADAITKTAKAADRAAVQFAMLNAQFLKDAEIQRQIRDDETKTFEERIEANNKLNTILEEQQKLQREQVQIGIDAAQNQFNLNDSEENFIALQEAKVAMLELEETITGQLSEQKTNAVALEKELLETQKEVRAEGLSGLERELQELQDAYDLKLEMARKSGEGTTAITKQYEKQKSDLVKANMLVQLDAYANLAGALSTLAGENKELAVAEAVMATWSGATKALSEGAGTPAGWINAAAIIAAGLSNVSKIMAVDVGTGGGGGNVGSMSSTPAPQMMSGAFDISGGVAPEATKAYVVTDEMSNSQNQLANIRRRATI